MGGGKGGGQTPAGDYLMSQLPANVTRATGIANKPFTPYTGQLAPPVPGQIANATTAAQGAANFTPQQVNAPIANAPAPVNAPTATAPTAKAADAGKYHMGLGGQDGLGMFLNPHLSNVADQTLAGIDRQRQMSLNQGSADAAMSNAWGGDRHGVADSLTNEAYGRISADTLANLYKGGFDTAAGLYMGDKAGSTQNQQFNAGLQQQTALANQGAGLQTSLANQQAGLAGQLANQNTGLQTNLANQRTGLAAGLANQNAGIQGANTNLQAAQTLGGLGNLQYGMQQDPVALQYQEFIRQQNYPAQTQALINAALGLVGSSTSGQYVTPQYPGMQMLGSALGGLGTGLGMGWGS